MHTKFLTFIVIFATSLSVHALSTQIVALVKAYPDLKADLEAIQPEDEAEFLAFVKTPEGQTQLKDMKAVAQIKKTDGATWTKLEEQQDKCYDDCLAQQPSQEKKDACKSSCWGQIAKQNVKICQMLANMNDSERISACVATKAPTKPTTPGPTPGRSHPA